MTFQVRLKTSWYMMGEPEEPPIVWQSCATTSPVVSFNWQFAWIIPGAHRELQRTISRFTPLENGVRMEIWVEWEIALPRSVSEVHETVRARRNVIGVNEKSRTPVVE